MAASESNAFKLYEKICKKIYLKKRKATLGSWRWNVFISAGVAIAQFKTAQKNAVNARVWPFNKSATPECQFRELQQSTLKPPKPRRSLLLLGYKSPTHERTTPVLFAPPPWLSVLQPADGPPTQGGGRQPPVS